MGSDVLHVAVARRMYVCTILVKHHMVEALHNRTPKLKAVHMRREGSKSVAAIIIVENTPNRSRETDKRRPSSVITLQEEDSQVDRIKEANEAGMGRKA